MTANPTSIDIYKKDDHSILPHSEILNDSDLKEAPIKYYNLPNDFKLELNSDNKDVIKIDCENAKKIVSVLKETLIKNHIKEFLKLTNQIMVLIKNIIECIFNNFVGNDCSINLFKNKFKNFENLVKKYNKLKNNKEMVSYITKGNIDSNINDNFFTINFNILFKIIYFDFNIIEINFNSTITNTGNINCSSVE